MFHVFVYFVVLSLQFIVMQSNKFLLHLQLFYFISQSHFKFLDTSIVANILNKVSFVFFVYKIVSKLKLRYFEIEL